MEHVIVSIVAQISKTYKPFLSAVVRNHIAQRNGFFAANRGQRRNIGIVVLRKVTALITFGNG